MASIGQRIKAAQVQAGIASVDELAEQPGRPDKFGAKTIGRVIRGDRKLQAHEAAWLAQTLRVEPNYLTDEDPEPSSADETQLDRIERRLTEIETQLNRVFHHRSQQGTEIIQTLRSVEAALAKTDGLLPGIQELLEAGQEDRSAAQQHSAHTAT